MDFFIAMILLKHLTLFSRPGFTRINLSYFIDDETANFVIDAVDMVTKYGWMLLPQVKFI